MYEYKAPLRDISFVSNELLDADTHYEKLGRGDEINQELRDAIYTEAAKFAETQIAPLRRVGDMEGCQLKDGIVTTPSGFKAAYQQFIDGGWPGLSMPEEFGGQGLPVSIDLVVTEMLGQANHPWAMYPGLSSGCRATILEHGTDAMQQDYLPKLVSGEWTGTMCLTEPQCGSDLSFLKTKAEPNEDGSYAITGTKIFISSGDHDMADNIIHVVLARLPVSPEGTKGISLFIVPKMLAGDSDNWDQGNQVSCGSLEHKMGIHGNATCVMNFDGSRGYLIGEPHKGLRCMFTFMNAARVGTAIQGLSHSEVAHQGALSYALEREAGRSLTGVKSPDRPADQLIVHPDVRRMLQTIRAFTEGNRAFAHYLGQLIDIDSYLSGEEKDQANNILGLLTPIAKGFMTEVGVEAASLGVQIYGGHGYIAEWGMEQNLRDSRISTLYEGTTGIQSLDLLGRKVLSDGGKGFAAFIAKLSEEIAACDPEFASVTSEKLSEWAAVTAQIGAKTMTSYDEIGAASVDYLMYSGYVLYAWLWAKMGTIAKAEIKTSDEAFYRVKLATARFYMQKILPRTASLKIQIEMGAETLMEVSQDDLQDTLGK